MATDSKCEVRARQEASQAAQTVKNNILSAVQTRESSRFAAEAAGKAASQRYDQVLRQKTSECRKL